MHCRSQVVKFFDFTVFLFDVAFVVPVKLNAGCYSTFSVVFAGYLTAGENTNIASGNYALLDIIAALHWVKENIANFTGDAGKVTLFGHGHGAALVNLLLVSPLTKGRSLK